MTIEISDELSRDIERAATLRGTDAQAFVIEATRRALESAPDANGAAESAEEKRLAAIQRLRGSVSSGSPTVDEFLRERSEEARREAQRDDEAWDAAQSANASDTSQSEATP